MVVYGGQCLTQNSLRGKGDETYTAEEGADKVNRTSVFGGLPLEGGEEGLKVGVDSRVLADSLGRVVPEEVPDRVRDLGVLVKVTDFVTHVESDLSALGVVRAEKVPVDEDLDTFGHDVEVQVLVVCCGDRSQGAAVTVVPSSRAVVQIVVQWLTSHDGDPFKVFAPGNENTNTVDVSVLLGGDG